MPQKSPNKWYMLITTGYLSAYDYTTTGLWNKMTYMVYLSNCMIGYYHMLETHSHTHIHTYIHIYTHCTHTFTHKLQSHTLYTQNHKLQTHMCTLQTNTTHAHYIHKQATNTHIAPV